MTALYPLKFTPIFKDKIWGGQKINTVLKKDFSPLPNCGELWALSGVEGDVSVVANGFLEGNDLTEVLEIYMDELVGDSVYKKYGNTFPILVKFLNSSDYLSVQVHPDDDVAIRKHGTSGKTEMWYIIDSDVDSELIIGLKDGMDRDTFEQMLHDGRIKETLNNIKIAPGDVFYIPSGRVHAIGKGVLLAEIQQTSDVTYRLYDWDRTDAQGNARELHIDEALDVIDFKPVADVYTTYARLSDIPVDVIDSPYFIVNNIVAENEQTFDLALRDSFTIFVCTQGQVDIIYENTKVLLEQGACVLIPADLNDFTIKPLTKSHLLEVFLR